MANETQHQTPLLDTLDCYQVTISHIGEDGQPDEIQIQHGAKTLTAYLLPAGSYRITDRGLGTAKVDVLENACLYGVDSNGRALDFSGAMLWLYGVGETIKVPIQWTPIVRCRMSTPNASILRVLTVDGYVTTLDARYPRHSNGGEGWTLYRTPDGWFFKTLCEDHSLRQEITDPSLESLLRRAAELPEPLPVYPRRPANPPAVEPFRKRERHWSLVGYGGVYTSRKTAIEGGKFWEHQARKDQDAWDRDFGPLTYGKVEGVDFTWKKS